MKWDYTTPQVMNIKSVIARESKRPDSYVFVTQKNGEKQGRFYKTQLCRYYTYHGYCQNHSKCTFAHGTNELQH
jgi:hypothetical protein